MKGTNCQVSDLKQTHPSEFASSPASQLLSLKAVRLVTGFWTVLAGPETVFRDDPLIGSIGTLSPESACPESVPIGGHSALASSCPRDSTFVSQPQVLTAWEAATKTVRKQSFGVTETRLSGTTLAGLESLIPHPHLVG